MTGSPLDPKLRIEVRTTLTNGRSRVFLMLDSVALHSDTLDLVSDLSRARFMKSCAEKVPGLAAGDLQELGQQLIQLAERGSRPRQEADNTAPDADDDLKDPTDSLPEIIVSDRQLRHVVRDGWAALLATGTAEMPALFVRDGCPIEVVQRDGGRVTAVTTDGRMAALIARGANWFRITKDGLMAVPPPVRVVQDMIHMASALLQPLDMIVATPLLGADGSLLMQPGYHPADRLILDCPLTVAPVPSQPSSGDLQWARETFDEILWDFPFVSPADRTNAVGACITPFVRRLVQDVVPLHSFEAPTPGTGKNVLVNAVTYPSLLQRPKTHSFPTDEAEIRKLITSILIEGPTVCLLDNAKQGRVIDSPNIAALLTLRKWSGRVLGISRLVHVPNEALWIMTGNNPRFSTEIARRIVRIRLDAKLDRPWERKVFRHPRLDAWIREHAADVIRAVLTFCQHWVATGRPASPVEMASFEHWSTVVGGIVTAAGYQGFLGNQEDIFELADSESIDWSDFTRAWRDEFGTASQSVSALRELCTKHDLLSEVLGDGSDRSQVTRLGTALAAQRDRSHNGLRVELARDGKHKGRQYRVVPVDGPPGEHGEPRGTLSVQGSPPQVIGKQDGCSDGGTLGNVFPDPKQNHLDLDVLPGLEGPDQRCDEASRPEGVLGSPRSPAVRSAELIEGCGGEPCLAEVPGTFPDVPGDPQAAELILERVPAAARRARGRVEDLEAGDVCCSATRCGGPA